MPQSPSVGPSKGADRSLERPSLLLVEGSDDKWVIANLCESNGVKPLSYFTIAEMGAELGGGYEKIQETLPRLLKAGNQTRLGIVVDADTDLYRRWQALQDLLKRQGYSTMPEKPQDDGIVLPGVSRTNEVDLPSIGVWIMPDNKIPGALEEFVRLLVPPENIPLWDHAEVCVANLPIKHSLAENWKSKARVYSYLAWQAEPGKPMGTAINTKYFVGNATAAQPFFRWLCRLFNIPITLLRPRRNLFLRRA